MVKIRKTRGVSRFGRIWTRGKIIKRYKKKTNGADKSENLISQSQTLSSLFFSQASDQSLLFSRSLSLSASSLPPINKHLSVSLPPFFRILLVNQSSLSTSLIHRVISNFDFFVFCLWFSSFFVDGFCLYCVNCRKVRFFFSFWDGGVASQESRRLWKPWEWWRSKSEVVTCSWAR